MSMNRAKICKCSRHLIYACPIVRRLSSKLEANCALFDTSMKFDTLITVTNRNIFRYSTKLELHGFSWKPQRIKIHEISLLFLVNPQNSYHFSGKKLFPMYVVFFFTRHVTLTMLCHGNANLKNIVQQSLNINEGCSSHGLTSGWFDYFFLPFFD